MSISRRRIVAGTCVVAACLSIEKSGLALAPSRGKKVTLLHLTDTHAQLETHWEYLPGRQPAIAPMSRSVRTNCWLLSIVSIAPIEFMTELRLFRGLKKSNSRSPSSSDNRLPHDLPILLIGLVAPASHPDRNPYTTVPNKASTPAVSAIASAPKM